MYTLKLYNFVFESLIGRESSGKSSLINALLGRKACPVASVPGSTSNARIHTMTLGNTLFEFCDVPGRGLSLIIYQILVPITIRTRTDKSYQKTSADP